MGVDHVGGDRFAANLVAFPHGWYFGRVDHDAGTIVAGAYADGRIDLAHVRGRSCHPIDVQAADVFLRTERRLDGVDDVSFAGIRRSGARSAVRFETRAGGVIVTVERSSAPSMRLTCHATQDRSAPMFTPVAIDAV